MVEIHHRVHVKGSPAQVFAALTEPAGPSRLWTREAGAAPRVDSLAQFRVAGEPATMRLAAIERDARLAWRCVDGPSDWIGTEVTFDLAPHGDETIVRLRHRHWREISDLMADCSATWAWLLFALKSLVETPEPDDVLV